MFRVVNLRNKKSWPTADGTEELIFKDGEDAKNAALALNAGVERPYRVYAPLANLGNWGAAMPLVLEEWFGQKDVYINPRDKWQVRKIATDANWRQEQHARFASERYKPVPWADQSEWQEWIKEAPQCDHFVHIAVDNAECIAYTKNAEAGELDIQTRTTPSKYFAKFKPDSKYYNFVNRWIVTWTKLQTAIELKFATTREEIKMVYENGPSSCMCGGVNRFFKHRAAPHPVESYAGGDLAVAYIQRKSGKISARVLCWPEKKIYNRLYGEDGSMLDSLLKAEGYVPGHLYGAKLCLVNVSKFTSQANTYLIPSIDTYPNTVTYLKDKKELRICHNPPTQEERVSKYNGCGNPQGYTTLHLPYVCERSRLTINPSVNQPLLVHVTKTKTQIWCASEVKEHAYFCYVNKRYYSKEKCPPTLAKVEGSVSIYKSPYEYKKK